MTPLGYFPGCSLTGSAAEYDRSLRAVAASLGVELREVPDWTCCGASSAHALDRDAALVLAASTLGQARRAGLDEVLAPCAMCFQRLATASHELSAHPALARSVERALEAPDGAAIDRVRVLSVLGWLDRVAPAAIAARVVKPLAGLRVACYYGCLLVRPPAVTGRADHHAPRDLQALVAAAGAEPVRWAMGEECCGASFAVSRKEVVLRQAGVIVAAARRAGADVVAVACPMCHSNLDLRQAALARRAGETPLPIVYVTQLLGLALGASEEALGLGDHFVPVAPALAAAEGRAGAARPGEPPCRR